MPSADQLLGFLQQQVDGQALDTRHRGNGFAAVLAVENEYRQDQVIHAQAMLAHQAPGKLVAPVAAQAGGGEQAIGRRNAHRDSRIRSADTA